MRTTPLLTRRHFVRTSALAAAALAAPRAAFAQASPPRFKIIGFSKPFASLGPEETADLVAEVGWDGIDCPVRTKSAQIAPERVEDELPKMAEALKKRGKEVTMITTEILKVDPLAEKVLRTAAALGIKRYRLGTAHYPKDKPIAETLANFTAALKDLAALNRELGVQGGYQNHSGADYIGGPLWDLWTAIKDLPPEQLGVCFDIGHTVIEGGLSWPLEVRLMEPHYVAIFLKDFRWERTDKGWQPKWCPFGEGAVPRRFLAELKKTAFAGPLCQHHEYDYGTGAKKIANFKKDLATLREWLAAA